MKRIVISFSIVLLSLVMFGCSKSIVSQDLPTVPAAQNPTITSAYLYGSVIATNPSAIDSLLQTNYTDWKNRYITASGAGGYLRVQRPENTNDTVSEGMAYGMLIAAYMNDKTTFDKLWGYSKSYLNSKGLMAWQISASGVVLGSGSASDADEDMALALVLADNKWGGYKTETTTLINKILAGEVDASQILRPGDSWGVTNVINPSYLAPAWYRVFQAYTGNSAWAAINTKSYAIFAMTRSTSTGLLPDWTTDTGASATSVTWDSNRDNFFYDAVRYPWRIAMDYLWFGNSQARSYSNDLGNFFQAIGASNIKDGYTLNGSVIGVTHNACFVGAAACAATAANVNTTFQSSIFNELVSLGTKGNYYCDTLRMISLLVATGKFTNPNELTPTADVTLETFDSVLSWGTFNGTSTLTIAQNTTTKIEGTASLAVNANNIDYCGLYKNFTSPMSWSSFSYIKYWIKGDNSNKEIRLEINDNGSERFEYKFRLNFTGWKQFVVPFSSLTRRTDWQPAGVPNDGLTLTGVEGLSFAPTQTGSYSFNVDTIKISQSSTPDVIAPTNTPPVANAGSNQNVNTGALVTLDGSGSYDPDGDTITYTWTQTSGPAVALTGATSKNPSFTATTAGTYTFSLVVNDGKTNSSASAITIVASTATGSADLLVEAFDSLSNIQTFTGASSISMVRDTSRKIEGTSSLKMTYTLSDYCGIGENFSSGQNWTGYQALKIQIYGNNNGKSYRLELTDNGGERFESIIVDNFSGWKQLNIPLSSFTRRNDWQPAGVPNDGLTLTGVLGFSLAPLTNGSGVLNVDAITLVNKTATAPLLVDALDAIGNWSVFKGGASSAAISITGTTKIQGTGALQLTLINNDYAGTGTSFSTAKNWSTYSKVNVWIKGANTGKQIRFEVADADDERYQYLINDNFTSWQQVSIPFTSFVRRPDWQPTGVPNNGFTLSGIRGVSFAPTTAPCSATWYFDQIEVQ